MKITYLMQRENRNAKNLNVAVWTSTLTLVIASAVCVGLWIGGKDNLARQAEQERAWAEQDAKIAAEVRAMSNSELIASTERDAAKCGAAK